MPDATAVGLTMYYQVIDSPIGGLLLAGTQEALYQMHFQGGRDSIEPCAEWEKNHKPFREVVRQLEAYFAGNRRTFDLPLRPEGTGFQRTVWTALQAIPYGETWSYGQLARYIGKPQAMRAVGAANGQNPIPVIIPCHRVIGADGSLTGFGGGLPIKKKLLELERGEPSLF